MRILIVAATAPEIQGILDRQTDGIKPPVTALVTGAGMVATALAMGRHLAVNQYDLAINLGIAGSFNRGIALGQVAEIVTDTLSGLGAEDGDGFITIEDLGFGASVFKPVDVPDTVQHLLKKFDLKTVDAITVNTVHGNEDTINKIMAQLNPQLESMEGAAFFYACQQFNLPCLQIRAVSNYVEKRNRANWQIGLAIKNLNNFANAFLAQLV